MDTEATPLHLLVLGGTAWLGGRVAALARDRGHRVTCLARGVSGAVPDGVTLVSSDRDAADAYAEVAQREWGAVLDVSWQPEQVRSALEALAERARHWVYVSSVSVYRDFTTPDATQTHAAWTGSGAASIEDYGPAKVACESACRAAIGDRLLIARAGLIVGYGDRSDRFGYWPGRFAQGEERPDVLTPPSNTAVQVIDVEDLAGWLVDCAERRVVATVDAVGERTDFAAVAHSCAAVTGTQPRVHPAEQDYLVERGVQPWSGEESLPLWLPLPEYAGMAARDDTAARASGLRPRPLDDTVRSALAWEQELGLGRVRGAGLSAARETDLVRGVIDLSTNR